MQDYKELARDLITKPDVQMFYKFLRFKDGKIMSNSGKQVWTIGKTVSVKGKIVRCNNGLHASVEPLQALSYVKGEILALVEAWGNTDNDDDKVCYRNMRIIKAVKWTETDSVSVAIYAAEQVLHIYEDKYPQDARPRDAIKAAKAYLEDPNKKTYAAASAAASAAYAASYAASYASYDAASAASAAYAAAYAVSYAAYAAASAAKRAGYADKECTEKINRYIKARFKKAHPYKQGE